MIGSLQAFLRGFELVGDGVSIHDTHVVNAVRPLNTNIPDQQAPLTPPPPTLVAVPPCPLPML